MRGEPGVRDRSLSPTPLMTIAMAQSSASSSSLFEGLTQKQQQQQQQQSASNFFSNTVPPVSNSNSNNSEPRTRRLATCEGTDTSCMNEQASNSPLQSQESTNGTAASAAASAASTPVTDKLLVLGLLDDNSPPPPPATSTSSPSTFPNRPVTVEPPLDQGTDGTHTTQTTSTTILRLRVCHNSIIVSADIALRLLRKFVRKTQSRISTVYQGTKPRGGLLSYLMFTMMTTTENKHDAVLFTSYRTLVNILLIKEKDALDDDDSSNHHETATSSATILNESELDDDDSTADADRMVDAVLGESSDTMDKAKRSIAAFVSLLSTWGHASSTLFENDKSHRKSSLASTSPQDFSELLSTCLDTATELVVYGCLDDVLMSHGDTDDDGNNNNNDCCPAVHMIAQSVFNTDLTFDRNELSAIKFLLSTGCRVTSSGNGGRGGALLNGSHLLMAIRTLYHVYLTTESQANKTTARAALQQLVTSVFTRLVQAAVDPTTRHTRLTSMAHVDNFPSDIHRDAYLVLRSICKLSMRNLPLPESSSSKSGPSLSSSSSGRSTRTEGLQTFGSIDATWDSGDRGVISSSNHYNGRGSGSTTSLMTNGCADPGTSVKQHPPHPPQQQQQHQQQHHHPQQQQHSKHVRAATIHPALESKLLALELLLYVLEHTDFSRDFIQSCGSQFHAAIRNYMCVSILKNCTSDDTRVVNLSLRIFVLLVRNFRVILKTEIEAFVTNVFFVILDSSNTPVEVKCLVVETFDEICSDSRTLAEIFLNYDCDLSAVDLFHRIVSTLSKVSRTGIQEPKSNGMSLMNGASASRMEKSRIENRQLRLDAMRALRQILASLHASIVEPHVSSPASRRPDGLSIAAVPSMQEGESNGDSCTEDKPEPVPIHRDGDSRLHLVEIHDSKMRRRAEESEVILRFNQKPTAGIAYASECKHINGDDPADVALYLFNNKDKFDKTQIGELLGREPDYQSGFSIKVLHEYVRFMDFTDLAFDEAIRFFLSGFRLPGEAQKIDRIMEKFAERYTEQNRDIFPSADAAFILSFSIIMLNTDLHNPAIKEERRMTKPGFIRNNRGICDGQDLSDELLSSIFDRIKSNPISLKEDDEARERFCSTKTSLPAALNPASFFVSRYDELDRTRETNLQKERDHIVRTTEFLLKRRRHHSIDSSQEIQSTTTRNGKSSQSAQKFVMTDDSGLRDEYVSPMFEVTWGPVLAAFSTALESANGTIGSLLSIASDEELEQAAENAAESIEVCLTGFQFAICTAGLCGNDIARDSFMFALSRFSQLGTGRLIEARHVRCIQTMLSLAKDDAELLGSSWSHVFRAVSEINRFHQLFHLLAKNDRAASATIAKRQRRIHKREKKLKIESKRNNDIAHGDETVSESNEDLSEADDSSIESVLFGKDDLPFEEDMDTKAIDEANARTMYYAVSENLVEEIYERSSSLSAEAVKNFVSVLCMISCEETSVGGSDYACDLNTVTYRQRHAMLASSTHGDSADQFYHHQPKIYNLQKLVEVTHYNMDSRPRFLFAELWSIVSDHLTSTALHRNPAISMYAVDSFRQLGVQYLQRDELEGFEFQRRFLKPLQFVMSKSNQSSTKKLLLDCVDHFINFFSKGNNTSNHESSQKGNLKSGWLPLLCILGLGGYETELEIATTSFIILTNELKRCISSKRYPSAMLSDYFVEAIEALFMYIMGPHQELGIAAFDQIASVCEYISTEVITPTQQRRKSFLSTSSKSASDSNQQLELWWPILLGLSQSVGDSRPQIRMQGLDTLIMIITTYFIPPDYSESSLKRTKLNEDVQNLQLIFRGILFPILEFAEVNSQHMITPSVPGDFQRFVVSKKNNHQSDELVVVVESSTGSPTWLETTFDPFIDACLAFCRQPTRTKDHDAIVDVALSFLSTCLVSDSGTVVVRGLGRLGKFVTCDLAPESLADDFWATVSHMLRRCLSIRNLPHCDKFIMESDCKDEGYAQAVDEFVTEDRVFPDRRYIGINATAIIGMLLTSPLFSIQLRWRLFLITGLGQGIVQWERAAELLEDDDSCSLQGTMQPMSYMDAALYGRMWMNTFLLQLSSMRDVITAPPSSSYEALKANRFASGQKLIVDEIKNLCDALAQLEKKNATLSLQNHHPSEYDVIVQDQLHSLVKNLLMGFIAMDDDHLKDMTWMHPALLACIRPLTKNDEIQSLIQTYVQKSLSDNGVVVFCDDGEVIMTDEVVDTRSVLGSSDCQERTGTGAHSQMRSANDADIYSL